MYWRKYMQKVLDGLAGQKGENILVSKYIPYGFALYFVAACRVSILKLRRNCDRISQSVSSLYFFKLVYYY